MAALWEVYWTFAYVLVPYTSENQPFLGPSFRPTTVVAMTAVAAAALPWIVLGLRSDADYARW